MGAVHAVALARKREREKKQRQRARAAAPQPSSIASFFRRPTTTGMAAAAPAMTSPAPPVANAPAATPKAALGRCSICVDVLCPEAVGNLACVTLPCNHVFHATCALSFARSSCLNHGLCPLCRAGASGSTSTSTTHHHRPSAPDSASKKTLEAAFRTVAPQMAADAPSAEAAPLSRAGFSVNGVRFGRPKGSTNNLGRVETGHRVC